MKINFFSKFLALFIFCAVAMVAGCKKDDACDSITCLNGGTCDDGTCTCLAGYEGTTCQTLTRDKFIAVYNVIESCSSGNYDYTITIQASSVNADEVILSNFGDFGSGLIKGTVNGTSLNISNQTIDISGVALTVSGSGSLNNNILTVTYTYSADGFSDSCSATCTKQ